MQQLADVITSDANGRFARTMVNRLWAQLMGRGLVETVDDLDRTCWNDTLLDFLAADLVANDYDLKQTLQLICTSAAYQAESVGMPASSEGEYVFAGPWVKRMSAEQFIDAIAAGSLVSLRSDGGENHRRGGQLETGQQGLEAHGG